MDQEAKLTIEQMKKIAHEIIDEETHKEKIELSAFPITFVEYYNDYIFREKLKLSKLNYVLTLPTYAAGFNDLKGNIVIFLNRINRIKKIENQIFKLSGICYHEVKHSIQKKLDDYSYNGFIRDIDHLIQYLNHRDYRQHHRKYSYEIGAHLYEISKSKEYLQKNYPDLYDKKREEIEQLERKYHFDYMTYDATDTIERMISLLRRFLKIRKVQKIRDLAKVSPVIEIFLNDDISFKKINEIINHEKFKTLDRRIVYAFLSSKSFLESINIEQLTTEELNLLIEALQYTNTLYQKQQQMIEKYEKQEMISLKEYLKSQKTLLEKITYLDRYITPIIKDEFQYTRNESQRQEHIQKIPDYLEQVNNMVKKRSKGYMTISICYIISFLIIILTIIYLIIK